jgi:hypothetical protein
MTVSAVTTPLATLVSALKLTSSQQSHITAIQQQYRQKMQVLSPRPTQTARFAQGQNRPATPDAATRTKIKDVQESSSDQISAVLTPDQVTALGSLIAQLKELASAQIAPTLYSQLNITKSQFTQIAAIEASAHDALKSEASKDVASGDFDELGQAIQDSHHDINAKVVALLTPTQAALLQNNRFGRGGFGGGQAMGVFRNGGQGQMGGGGGGNVDAMGAGGDGGPGGPGDDGPGGDGGPGGPGNDGPGGPGGGGPGGPGNDGPGGN